MDLQNPLRSLAPTVDADVLAVLAGSRRPLTGAAVERLAARSHAQVRTVLHRLVKTGLVEADRVGQAVQYRFNREHVLASGIEEMLRGAVVVESRLREHVAACDPAPDSVVVFGSFACRTGGEDSDVDLLLVRPQHVDADDLHWAEVRSSIAQHLEAWTGNSCQVIEVSPLELREAAARTEPLVASLSTDGRDVFGAPIGDLLGLRGRRSPPSAEA
ncbi:MAG: nucleotidyltransferase domain-containing protein [Acidimicrobiales bacterium]